MIIYCRNMASLILIFVLVLSGCASYKYSSGVKPYGEGYVVARNNTVIPEYTIGVENKAPLDLGLAKERFKARRGKVEYYYKKMEIIYNQLSAFMAYPSFIWGMVTGVFKLPFILASNYRYERNAAYRKKIDARDMEKRLSEERKRKELEDKLNNFIKQELEKETQDQ